MRRRDKTIVIFPIIVGILLLSACEAEQSRVFVPVMPDQKTRHFNYPFDDVWDVLVNVLASQDIDIETFDKERGVIITDFIPLNPKSELGQASLFPEKGERIIEKAKYDIAIAVMENEGKGISVQLEVHLSKYSRSLMSYYKWRDQLSNGIIEQRMFDSLEAELENP